MDPVEQPNKVPATVITLTARPDNCLHPARGVSQLINSNPWEAQLEKHETESKPKTSPGTPAHERVISAATLLPP